MKRYKEYKDSGVEWLGEIPIGWNRNRIKFCFTSISGGVWGTEPLGNSNDIVCIRVADFDYKHGTINTTNLTTRNISNSEQEKRLLKKGDLLLEKSGGGELNPVGRIVKFDLEIKAVCSNFINRLNTKKQFSANFLNYLNKFLYSKGLTESCINQTTGIQNLKIGEFVSNEIYLPPLPEQNSIVKFLDHKTERIDRFIANRKKQIDLFKEQKAAIINNAVTKGINPNAKMKDSGIEWIGEVPEHWKIGKTRRVLEVLTDFTANGSFADLAKNVKYLDTPDFSRLIRLTDLREDLKNDGIYVSKDAHQFLAKSELYGGEILMANVGAYAGLVCLVPEIDFTATLGPNMFLLKFHSKWLSNQYAFTLLSSNAYYKLLMNKALSSAQPKLNKEDVKSIDLVFPLSIEEQKDILNYIEEETSTIDTLITKYQKQIDLMQEYSTALISQAVTGKIDVRDWQPKQNK